MVHRCCVALLDAQDRLDVLLSRLRFHARAIWLCRFRHNYDLIISAGRIDTRCARCGRQLGPGWDCRLTNSIGRIADADE